MSNIQFSGFARRNEQRVTGANNQALMLPFQFRSSLWSWSNDWNRQMAVTSHLQAQNSDCSMPEHAVRVVERRHQGEFSNTSFCSPVSLIRKRQMGLQSSLYNPAAITVTWRKRPVWGWKVKARTCKGDSTYFRPGSVSFRKILRQKEASL
jgi:hypothetical protein